MSNPQRILMCPPDHFHVNYAINPWMHGNQDQVSQQEAARQWQELKALVERFARVELIQPQPGVPDMVFTANAGTVCGDQAVVSRFAHRERKPEEPYFETWFQGDGYQVHTLPEEINFEGAGDALFDRANPWLWAGAGFRTDPESHDYLRQYFDMEVLSIRLVDERFYHIDTCFCPLAGGWLMYYPGAYDVASNELIESRVPEDKRIEVTEQEAADFSCNAINIGQHVIMHACSERLRDALSSAGFQVHTTSLREFLKAGGSAKCLSLKLNEPEAYPER